MSDTARLLLSFSLVGCLTLLPAQVSKTIDLSTVRAQQSYYVVLAARGGSATGHALVVWGIEDDTHQRSTIQALGLYPERDSDNCSSVVRTVPGQVMDEMRNHSVQEINQQLIVKVDQEDFERSRSVAREWDCRHEFSLLSRDCVEFLRAAGESLRLPMPSRGVTRWTPQAYLRAVLASVGDGRIEMEDGVYLGTVMGRAPMGRGVMLYADGAEVEGVFHGNEPVKIAAR